MSTIKFSLVGVTETPNKNGSLDVKKSVLGSFSDAKAAKIAANVEMEAGRPTFLLIDHLAKKETTYKKDRKNYILSTQAYLGDIPEVENVRVSHVSDAPKKAKAPAKKAAASKKNKEA